MKPSSFFSVLFVLTLLLTSFTWETNHRRKYEIKIKGVESNSLLILKEGISAAELNEMTIETKKSRTHVASFNVVLARGPRPVDTPEKVDGNKFDLSGYSRVARKGDRISIEILELIRIKDNDVLKVKDYLTIPIK